MTCCCLDPVFKLFRVCLAHEDSGVWTGGGGRNEPGLGDIVSEAVDVPCRVMTGKVPHWIDGVFYRQCGAAFLPPSATVGFAFVHGLAHVAAFRIKEARVRMSNRCVRTDAHKKYVSAGERTWANPHENNLSNASPHTSNTLYNGPNPNVTVWHLSKKESRIAVLSEAQRGRIISLEAKTLDTLEVIDTIDANEAFQHAAHFYSEGESSGFHVALHCQRSTASALHFAYAIYHGDAANPPFKCVATVPVADFNRDAADQQPEEKRISYAHTIAVTPNYVVVFASARRLNYAKWLGQSDGGATPGFFDLWPYTERPASVHVFKRTGHNADLQYIGERHAQRCHMIWHTCNAYECKQSGDIIIDVVSMLPSRARQLVRLQVPTSETGTVRSDIDISMNLQEFPCVNPYWHGHKYCYAYGLSFPFMASKSALYKVNVTTGEHLEWRDPLYCPSEPCFVPQPDAEREDTGVVLSMINHSEVDKSFLLVLDGTTFQEIARVATPCVVNHGLHSVFIPTLLPPIARY